MAIVMNNVQLAPGEKEKQNKTKKKKTQKKLSLTLVTNLNCSYSEAVEISSVMLI